MNKQFYMTPDEFFAALREAWDEDHRGDTNQQWHPEDLAINISAIANNVGFFMSALIKMRRHR